MADYDIYIKDLTSNNLSGGFSKQTTPFSNFSDEENPMNSFAPISNSSFVGETQQFLSGGLGPMISQGISKLGKVAPYVAVAYAAAKLFAKAVRVTADYMATYQGNPQFQMDVNNVVTALGNFANPISLGVNMIKTRLEFAKNNQKVEATNRLIGGSVINVYNRGV